MINFDEYSKRIYLTGAAPNDSVQIYLLTNQSINLPPKKLKSEVKNTRTLA